MDCPIGLNCSKECKDRSITVISTQRTIQTGLFKDSIVPAFKVEIHCNKFNIKDSD